MESEQQQETSVSLRSGCSLQAFAAAHRCCVLTFSLKQKEWGVQTASVRGGTAAASISAVGGILSASDPGSPRAPIGRASVAV